MSIRIIIDKPKELSGKNLFGTIVKERSNTLLVELSEPLKVDNFSSDLVQLATLNGNDNFNSLNQYYAVFVKGILINPLLAISEGTFTATVTLD